MAGAGFEFATSSFDTTPNVEFFYSILKAGRLMMRSA